MHGKTPTKADRRRFLEIQDRGCVPCWLEARMRRAYWLPEPCDIHHVDQSSHQATYGNCPWHHRGIPKNGLNNVDATACYGPSMAHEPRRYRERYGTEQQLLALQNRMLLESVETLREKARAGTRSRQTHSGQ